MKIAIITDQHFGCRKNSKVFHDYFLEFYNNIFFPKLEELGITTIVDMGDTFDSRKGIDFAALSWAKDNYSDRLSQMGCTIHTIVGNHTAYYKNTNDVNAVDLLLREYDNIKIYSEATDIKLDKLSILLIPWINSENKKQTMKVINQSKSPCVMGHLECKGFEINPGFVMDHGTDVKTFDKFEKVYSGHYHTRSDNGKVYYLGNPYEMYWNDVGDIRGFHIFDTDTMEHTPVNNPYKIFHNLYYEDDDAQLLDTRQFAGKILKLIVRKKSDPKKFERYIDKIYASDVHELKILENFQLQENEEFEAFESEDTLSILNRYVEESEIDLQKSTIQDIIKEVYQEACEVI